MLKVFLEVTMKKLSLTLAFVLALCSFTGCGSDSSSDKADKKDSSSSVEETTAEAETTEESTEDSTDDEKDEKTTEAASEETSMPAAAENTDFKKGVIDGDVYTSDFAGVKFTAPEGWTFAKDDYILSMMNIGLEAMGDDAAITKALLDQAVIYDALCMDQTTGANIIFEFENLAKEVPDPSKYTLDDVIDSFDKQLSAVSSIKYEKKETDTVTLAGQEYTKLVYSAEMSNISMEQVFYVRREGDLVFCIIASNGQSGEDMTKYEANIEALN
jgi:hypothetical protein